MAKRQRGRRVPPPVITPPVMDDDEPGLFDEPPPERPPLQRVVDGIPAEMDANSLDSVLWLMAREDVVDDLPVPENVVVEPQGLGVVFEHALCPVRAQITAQGACVLTGRFTVALDAIAADIRARCYKELAAARQVAAGFVEKVYALFAAAHQYAQGHAVVLSGDYFAGKSFEEALGHLSFDYHCEVAPQPCAEKLLLRTLWHKEPAAAVWLISVTAVYWEGHAEGREEGHAEAQRALLPSPGDVFAVAPVASVRAGAYFWFLEEGETKTIGNPYLRLDVVQKDGAVLVVDTATWQVVALVPEAPVAILPEVAEESQE